MRRPTRKFHKGASSVLAGLAIAAVAFLAGGSTAQAQAKSWEKIKYPPLPEFKVPSPERFTMPNGITVLMLEDHELPLIQMDVRIKTGIRLEPSDMAGLAEVMGDVMRSGGAGSRNGDEIDEYLESRGAVINSSVTDTSGQVSMSCLKNDFPDIVKVVSDILRDPKFDQKKIDVSKNQMKASIARRNDNPASITFREGRRLVYGPDSAYSRLVQYATLDKFHRDDLLAFHARYYIPNRVYIGVTGDFDSASMKKTLESVFGDWKKGPDVKDQLPAIQSSAKPGIYWVDKEDVTQSNIFMGELGIERNDPDYYAARVMNEILSGSFASRLFNNIRTVKGLAYSVRGSLGANYDYPGIFSMSMSTKTETTAASIDALLEEVDRLTSSPPTPEEMERAREGLLNSFIFNFDTNEKIMAQQLTLAYYGYPSDFLEKFRDHIEKVTADDIFQLAKKRVHKDQLAILVVGKSKGMDRPLASLGKVHEIDVSIPEPAASATAIAAAPGMSVEQAEKKGKMVFSHLLEAVGGAAKVDAVKSIKTESGMSVATPQGEFQLASTQIFVLPDRFRRDLKTPMGTQTQVVTPTSAFVQMGTHTRPMSDSQKADGVNAMKREIVPLLQARNSPDLKVLYTGTEKVNGADCDLIGVAIGGTNVKLAVDQATGRLEQASYQGKNMQGVPGEITVTYSDHHNVDGIEMPWTSNITFDGQKMITQEVKSMVINGEIDEAVFKMPEGATAGGPSGGK